MCYLLKRLLFGRKPRPNLVLCPHCGHRIKLECRGYPDKHCYCGEGSRTKDEHDIKVYGMQPFPMEEVNIETSITKKYRDEKVASSESLVKMLKNLDSDVIKKVCISIAEERVRKHDQTLREVAYRSGDEMIKGIQSKGGSGSKIKRCSVSGCHNYWTPAQVGKSVDHIDILHTPESCGWELIEDGWLCSKHSEVNDEQSNLICNKCREQNTKET